MKYFSFRIKKKFYIGIVLALTLGFIACTKDKKRIPEISQYSRQTNLILGVCGKFAQETDIKRLHSAAIATLQSRLVTCSDFNGECSKYGHFVSTVIKDSKDGVMTPSERKDLQDRLKDIQNSIAAGKKMIYEASKDK